MDTKRQVTLRKETHDEGEPYETLETLRRFREEVRDRTPTDINEMAAQVLVDDADSLICQIPKRNHDEEGITIQANELALNGGTLRQGDIHHNSPWKTP
jgi:hypothetical protein